MSNMAVLSDSTWEFHAVSGLILVNQRGHNHHQLGRVNTLLTCHVLGGTVVWRVQIWGYHCTLPSCSLEKGEVRRPPPDRERTGDVPWLRYR